MTWYFDVSSAEFGTETFGPYDTDVEAQQGIDRVRAEAAALDDDIDRHFSGPYQQSER
jgi:hypothetical protein